jgi:pyruvate dehydrogenase E2 component (dihydrolipoamide acetyltransferase)
MQREFAMPDVGEGLTEAEIVTWNVAVGDAVVVNQILCEIETAKAAVELPSPFAGTIVALRAQPGETIAVGRPIVVIDTAEPGGAAPAAAPAPPAEEGGAKIGEAGVDGRIATLVGYGPRPGSVARRPRRAPASAGAAPAGGASAGARAAHPRPSPAGAAPAASAQAGAAAEAAVAGAAPAAPAVGAGSAHPGSAYAPAGAAQAAAGRAGAYRPGTDQPAFGAAGSATAVGSDPSAPLRPAGTVPLAKPPVRKLAKDLGVDLREVISSRPDGVITREDVQAFVNGAPPEPEAPQATVGERREPIRGVRRATATAMVASAFTAPHVTEFLAVDVTETMALRDRLRASREYADVRLTPLAFVAKAVCLAARRTPEVNAHWDEAAGEIVYYDRVQLGIAAATPRGLIVPKIRNADALSLAQLATALGELTATAREGKTPPADLVGGTFTITNVGVFGVDTGTPILNPGEAAILAVGSIKQAPWVVDGALAVRTVCQLALSFDHRLVDGEQGSRFLADVGRLLEDPGLALTY